jgi:hypothetical protein
MGNISKKDKAVIHGQYTVMLDRISDAIVRSGRFVVEEGITIGFAAMLWRITGEVKQLDMNGDETPEWAIREALIDGLATLRTVLNLEIPLVGIAPNSWLVPIVRAYENMMYGKVRGSWETDPETGGYVMAAIPLVERLEIVVILPGLFRTLIEMMKGLVAKP